VLHANDLIQPYFVVAGKNVIESIDSMPGVFRYSVDELLKEVERLIKSGGKACLLFGIATKKDSKGSEAYSDKGVVQTAIKVLKQEFPEFCVMTDVCLCGFTDHGHCGVVENDYVDNDKTIALLGKIAVSHAKAGSDVIAPSDMMDFRVRQIREDLDANGFVNKAIMSYAVKYQSAYYGPFRDAANSSPEFGDRKTYQMDCANQIEALKEAKQDVCEGADMIMVKPALAYLDIISMLKNELDLPIVAYNVSGEYAMVKAAAQNKWIDEKNIVLENLTAMKRAGADIIISYHAREALQWLR